MPARGCGTRPGTGLANQVARTAKFSGLVLGVAAGAAVAVASGVAVLSNFPRRIGRED